MTLKKSRSFGKRKRFPVSAASSFELDSGHLGFNTSTVIIGIPREIKQQEYRVSLPPSAAYQLIKRGHEVLVETQAGVGAGFPDTDYEAAGAQILKEHKVVFERAELVVKVKEPQESETSLFKPGQILFTYLHLAANK